jgi:hypothetical protein
MIRSRADWSGARTCSSDSPSMNLASTVEASTAGLARKRSQF